MSTLYFRIFKKSTNKLKYLTSYKLYITSLKRYYSSTIYYKECAYGSKVLETLQKNRPVIILESTISHGVPYPQNLAIVTGNKPATTATLDGKINAYRNRLETFARRELETRKNFRASHELIETSTFSRSIFTAYRAVTDLSTDLVELERIPIAVVCTGARIKSIWNIRETLEYLETQGVLVSIFGEIKKYFQALFILKNGFKSQLNLKSIKESVGLINASTNSGLAISTPISTANSDETQRTIDTTLAEAKEISENNGVSLRINQAYSLKSNIPLVKNNAKINGNSKLELKGEFKKKVPAPFLQEYEKPSTSSIFNQELIIVGGTAVDITSTLDPFITDYVKTSSPGTIRQSIGGVGRNIAETSFRLGVNPLFISAIGNDLSGNWLKTKFEKIGMETGGLQIINNESTAVYNAIHDSSGNLICAVADMKIFDYLSSDKISQTIKMGKPKLVCFDGNISAGCIYNILNTCKTYNISTFFETTSISKSLKLLENYEQFIQLLSSQSLKYISPNSFELKTMYFTAYKNGLFDLNSEWVKRINEYDIGNLSIHNPTIEVLINSLIDCQLDTQLISESFVQTLHFLPYIPNIIVKLGENEKNGKSGLRLKYFKPIKFDKNEIVNVTGAGDSVVGTLVSGFILHGETKIDKIIEVAQYIALMTLKTHNSVSEDINEKLLEFSS
ncbi:pseudouridine-metabolizing bifunctional protein C1861.05-like [Rhizophagus irregularis DAOM 181602=DAOM 197198]|nr:pseudouridine-metabolizing bifunctional protein C1861.05-like [Rhizophagus irregularis DAOM 181602=DAOM 197198]